MQIETRDNKSDDYSNGKIYEKTSFRVKKLVTSENTFTIIAKNLMCCHQSCQRVTSEDVNSLLDQLMCEEINVLSFVIHSPFVASSNHILI